MAKSSRKNGVDERALSVLQEVLDTYPDHPDAKVARRLQEEWKK